MTVETQSSQAQDRDNDAVTEPTDTAAAATDAIASAEDNAPEPTPATADSNAAATSPANNAADSAQNPPPNDGKRRDVIPPEHAETLYGLFAERVVRSTESIAYRQFDKASKTWQELTWHDVAQRVMQWQSRLQQEKLQHGDRVAILMRNAAEWVAFDQAALSLGLVVIPLYCDDRADNVAYILKDAGCKLLLVENAGQWRRLSPAVRIVECLDTILIAEPGDDEPKPPHPKLQVLQHWLDDTKNALTSLLPATGDRHQLASIVYTSGTTGRPKGVMLSHWNMLSVAYASTQALDVYADDIFLSFLPMSHTFERTCGYYVPIMSGATVGFSRGILQLADDLTIIRPTAMIAVPRIFERVYGRVQQQLAKDSKFKQFMFGLAVRVGWQNFEHQQGRTRWNPKLLLWPLLKKLVAEKILNRLGGRLRIAVAGGAALPPTVAKTFIGLGLPLVQGYGMTESSPVVCVNRVDNNRPTSVGTVLPGMQVRAGDNDELQVKTPGIMMGYWGLDEATQKTIMGDGWLHTGDQAHIDEDTGHITITGRIKDIIVMSNGEKVPPGDMENAISLDPLFEQVMVLGEGEAFLSAIVVLNPDEWYDYAKEHGFDPLAAEETVFADPKLERTIVNRIQKLLKDFPGYAKVRKVTLTTDPWTVENGLLTPTLKVKRPKVMEQYDRAIQRMYAEPKK